VEDSGNGDRSVTATDTVFVQDSLGSMGSRPVLVDSLYLFDDFVKLMNDYKGGAR